PNGVSFGRYVNSVGFEDFVAMDHFTFGVDDPGTVEQFRQGQGEPNSYPKVGPVVISEIMYHPPDIGTNDNVRDEYIELYNNSSVPVPLFDTANQTNTWRLRDAIDFEFSPGTVIQPYSYLIVVSFDPQTNLEALAEFKAQYKISDGAVIVGPYSGKLANADENIELYRPLEPTPDTNSHGVVKIVVPYVLVERVHYYDNGSWPVEADGNGYSLNRVSFTGYANEPTNWVALPPSPVPQGLLIVSQPQSISTYCGENVSFFVAVSGQEPITYQWYFETAPILNQTNSILNLVNVCTANAGNYFVIATNLQGSITSAVATLTIIQGQPPMTQPDNVLGLKNYQLIIPGELLLANDSDPNSSTLSIVNVAKSSSTTGNVSLANNNVIYTPADNYTGIDEFQYTVRNGYGMQATGVVYVTVAV
ncbi:MAG TPA: cadherin-like domain-containing protein, partial [Verrucomicrobiota bacterium]|nr:cadherin-like domain-containing protein [Verrucomicrobiota bacterium]